MPTTIQKYQKEVQLYVQKIKEIPYFEEKQIMVVQGILEIFPFYRAGLHFYSPLSKDGEGIIRMDERGVHSIRDRRDDVRNMPPIFEAIREQKPVYLDQTLIRQLPSRFTEGIHDLLILPLIRGRITVGYIAMSQRNPAPLHKEVLDALMLFGKLIGEILGDEGVVITKSILNEREIEILQKIAWGESNKEIADSLKISMFTVQDYVKSIIKKLNVLNRPHAVAVGIREGIIK